MRDLYFFTSNRAKLAHLKHIARKYGLEVHGFRELTYMGPYQEPKIRDREELLRQSYESAAEKWRKGIGKSDSRIFILEDTSVRVDALSDTDEVPGVDVKYWMRKMSFGKLNALLKERGNVRTATVRSDIVAHIPERLRDVMGGGDPFIWVYGETPGRIIDAELVVSTNLVYPWLDGNSFNKWFIPKGYSQPMSALKIAEADACDFRSKAFENLLSQFRGVLAPDPEERIPEQLLLPGLMAEPPILIISGYSCAGKTVLANWLADRYGLLHLEASDYMRQAYWERHGMNSHVAITDFALAALKVEPWIAARPIAKDIKRLGYPAVVVTGFRSPGEEIELQRELGRSRPVKTIFIEASREIRFERARFRGREAVSTKTFQARDRNEREMGIETIKSSTTGRTVVNDFKTKDAYFRQFMKQWGSDVHTLHRMTQDDVSLSMGNLEQLILLTLMNAQDGVWLTTAQIAAGIEYFFQQRKSKNNVSRYFNQEFHPFYRADDIGGKTVYRLSTTGESIARLLEVTREFNKTA